MFCTLLVSKFFMFNEFNSLRLSNICDISITDIVLKDERSILFKYIHSLNMLFIFITFLVLKFDKSNSQRLSQFSNICDISKTFSVLKLDTFKYGIPIQSLNIPVIFVTLLVSK